jgi:hypothetical protein
MKAIIIFGTVLATLMFGLSVQGEDIAPPSPEYCGFNLPATYYGEVRTIGFETQAGSALIARTEQFAWQGELVPRGYVIDVYQRIDWISPPCFNGGVITFTLDGNRCYPWSLWASGRHDIDLLCVH